MKAVTYENFGAPLKTTEVPDPKTHDDGVVIKVEASGICRSDWHGWRGHDPGITKLPHVPGHELSGVVEEAGRNVAKWRRGARVTVPFVCGCGTCPECTSGNHHVCDHQFQPGFTDWGSFAQFVSIKHADTNLVGLPDDVDSVTAASLGCRFSTSFRAVVVQGGVTHDQWVAVHGCGGVGLSAIMIARALDARVVAIDIEAKALELAVSLGANATVNAAEESDVVSRIHEVTGRGAHVSLDALGSATTCTNSILCLRPRGRHVQVGLLVGEHHQPRIPMDRVVAKELQLFGTHGMPAVEYGALLEMIVAGRLDPELIIGKTISLGEAPGALENMDRSGAAGIVVIDRF